MKSEDFEKVKVIGRGAFGEVQLVTPILKMKLSSTTELNSLNKCIPFMLHTFIMFNDVICTFSIVIPGIFVFSHNFLHF